MRRPHTRQVARQCHRSPRNLCRTALLNGTARQTGDAVGLAAPIDSRPYRLNGLRWRATQTRDAPDCRSPSAQPESTDSANSSAIRITLPRHIAPMGFSRAPPARSPPLIPAHSVDLFADIASIDPKTLFRFLRSIRRGKRTGLITHAGARDSNDSPRCNRLLGMPRVDSPLHFLVGTASPQTSLDPAFARTALEQAEHALLLISSR